MKLNFKDIILNSNKTVKDALQLIDKQPIKTLVIVDANDRLIGTITDGDIRRALLNGIKINDSIIQAAHLNPITAKEPISNLELFQLHKETGLNAIPIISDHNLLIDIYFPDSDINHSHYLNPIFIMAGGFGTRLKPLTDNCPKPMLPIGNKPILEIMIQHFIKQGFNNFYISTHYLPEIIKSHFGNGQDLGINIQYVYEKEPLGTGGALSLLPDDITNLPLIMVNGDILTNMNFENLLNFHNSHSSNVTMCVREFQYQIPYGTVESENNIVKHLSEKPINYFNINTGIYILNPNIYKDLEKNTSISMPELIEKAIYSKQKVMSYNLNEYWLDIGQMKDYHQAQIDIKSLIW